MSKTVILVCTHKQAPCLSTPPFLPIHVGKALSNLDLHCIGDDTGDNISIKNPSYSETPAIYWAWKNLENVDYLGLNHYRRHFDFTKNSGYHLKTVSAEKFFASKYYIPDMDAVFQKYDIVMASPKIYPYSLYANYAKVHFKKDMDTAREVIGEMYPMYIDAFDKILLGNRLSPYNMFILPRERFEDYSKWLFDILFEIEKRVPIRENYQSRVLGYISERLLSVYVKHNRLKVCYKNVILIDDAKPKNFVKYLFHITRNNLIYYMTYLFCKSKRRT